MRFWPFFLCSRFFFSSFLVVDRLVEDQKDDLHQEKSRPSASRPLLRAAGYLSKILGGREQGGSPMRAVAVRRYTQQSSRVIVLMLEHCNGNERVACSLKFRSPAVEVSDGFKR